MAGQGQGSIKPWGILRHAYSGMQIFCALCFRASSHPECEDWDCRRAGIKSLECQAKQLGLYQQAMGS